MEGERGKTLRFALLADVHFRTEDTARARKDEADLRRCMEAFGTAGAAFLLQMGDLLSGSRERAPEELRRALAALDAFRGPIHHLIGNHDLEALPQEALLPAFGLSRSYYAFTAGGIRFIALDSMELSLLREPGTEEERNALEEWKGLPEWQPWCGAVGPRQKAWLGDELRRAEEEGTAAIVLSHLPLHPETTDLRHGILWNHREIRELLSASPAVRGCIAGHFHPGAETRDGGVQYLTLPAFSTRDDRSGGACFLADLDRERLAIRGTGGTPLFVIELRT